MTKGWRITFGVLIVLALVGGYTKAKNGKMFSFKKAA